MKQKLVYGHGEAMWAVSGYFCSGYGYDLAPMDCRTHLTRPHEDEARAESLPA